MGLAVRFAAVFTLVMALLGCSGRPQKPVDLPAPMQTTSLGIGDVFELKAGPRLLADLDRYEGFTGADNDVFRRIAVEVALDLGGTLEAWTYGLLKAPRARLIGTGAFIADRRMRVPRTARP